jgi:hypothetical protein
MLGFVCSVDYPKPIVKHEDVSKANMSKMKLAYDAHKAAAGGADVEYEGGYFFVPVSCCFDVQTFICRAGLGLPSEWSFGIFFFQLAKIELNPSA